MNQEQKKQLESIIERFDMELLIECADANYKGRDWNIEISDGYTVNSFIQLAGKIFLQLKAGLRSDCFSIYSWAYDPTGIGVSEILTELTNVLNGILKREPFTEYIFSIGWLVKYLMEHDLWEKENETISSSDLNEKYITLTSVIEKVKIELNSIEQIKIQYTLQTEGLNQFQEQKKQELQIITDAIPTLNIQKTEIDSILKNVQQTNAELRAIQTNHNVLYDQLKEQKETQEKEFKLVADKLAVENSKLKETIVAADEKVKYFLSLEEFIKEKQKEIIRLTGLAADGTLGHTFNARRDELRRPVNFWKCAMPVMTVVTIVWVIAVFTQFFQNAPISVDWLVVLMNIVKTIPMFVLLGFTINQYTKERNLQEEYAFKAAVAMTITAYSDKLSDIKNKETLVMETVRNIYTAPKIQIEKSGSIISFRTKGLNDAMKILTEAVKEIKK